MWILCVTALAAPAPGVTPQDGPLGPEPVLEHAEADLKALRGARTTQVAAIAMPGLLIAGTFGFNKLSRGVGRDNVRINAAEATSLVLGLVGAAGMGWAPTVFDHRARTSARALRAQGLEVKRTPPVLVPALAVSSVLVVSAGTYVAAQEDDVSVGVLLFGLGMYGAAVGIPTYQLDQNRRARESAGWLGVAPVPGRAPGLAVVGRW